MKFIIPDPALCCSTVIYGSDVDDRQSLINSHQCKVDEISGCRGPNT